MKKVKQENLSAELENKQEPTRVSVDDLQTMLFKDNEFIESVMSTRLFTLTTSWEKLTKEQREYYELKRPNDIIKDKETSKPLSVYRYPQHENKLMIYLNKCTPFDLVSWALKSLVIRYRDNYLKNKRIINRNGIVKVITDVDDYLQKHKAMETMLSTFNESNKIRKSKDEIAEDYLSSLSPEDLLKFVEGIKAKKVS